jgi:hypothetical protein
LATAAALALGIAAAASLLSEGWQGRLKLIAVARRLGA